MNKVEIVHYIADLLTIDDYLDDLGITNDWLNREEHRYMLELEQVLKVEQEKEDAAKKAQERAVVSQEKEDEARKINERRARELEERANPQGSFTRRG